ncbi:MAG: LysM peptidoglycan-binding domain-containing protein, partial [Acidimicrobiales bacterium]
TTTLPAPTTTLPAPTTTLPAPTTTLPAPTTTLPAPATTTPPPATSGPTTVVVQPGDSFWTLASRVAEERSGGTPSQAEVATLWRAMVVANASRLYDPDDGNANLIYAGQVFVVPAT